MSDKTHKPKPDETPAPQPAAESDADALRRRVAELEAALEAAQNAPPPSPAVDDKAFAKSPKHTHSFDVRAIAGPKRNAAPARVAHCCDESEAIRRYAARNGMVTNEHRYQVTRVDQSA